jgi:hypothetical protein
VSPPANVGKKLQPCLKKVIVVSIPSSTREVSTIVPMQIVTEEVAIFSEEKKPAVDEVVVCTDVLVEEDVPLRGLNLQLKKVPDDACKTTDKGQRWSLF